jgi:hypothetical protein
MSKGDEVPEKWSALSDGLETKGIHPVYAHWSFEANAEMTGRKRRIYCACS